MRNLIEFSSWQGLLSTLLGLILVTVVVVGIRLLVMQHVQQRRERQNRQINERLQDAHRGLQNAGRVFHGQPGRGPQPPARYACAPPPGPKFDYKLAWFERLRMHAAELLKSGHPVVLAGGFNVVPTDADIYSPKTWLEQRLAPAGSANGVRQGWTDSIRAQRGELFDAEHQHGVVLLRKQRVTRQMHVGGAAGAGVPDVVDRSPFDPRSHTTS